MSGGIDTGCSDPHAPIALCCVCGKPVHTCESEIAHYHDKNAGPDYTCAIHPEGCELTGGRWVCSHTCWDIAVEDDETELL